MKRFYILFTFLSMIFLPLALSSNANAQSSNTKEVYTGTVLSYGSGFNTRAVTSKFSLNINGQTSNEQAQSFLNILQEDAQKDLLNAISKEDLGRFSIGANVGVPINVVRESTVDGKRRIFIVFERLTQFAELRGGYRSLDYPFGVIELFIDERTGKGEGTYIAAAKIRWDYDEKKQQHQVEIENFATYPARLLGVSLRGENKRRVIIK
jgi:hypothetical protein